MSDERVETSTRGSVPDLDGAIMGCRDDTELIHVYCPDALDMPEKCTSTRCFFDVPHLDGTRQDKRLSARVPLKSAIIKNALIVRAADDERGFTLTEIYEG